MAYPCARDVPDERSSTTNERQTAIGMALAAMVLLCPGWNSSIPPSGQLLGCVEKTSEAIEAITETTSHELTGDSKADYTA